MSMETERRERSDLGREEFRENARAETPPCQELVRDEREAFADQCFKAAAM
jgi:hypothetical protein